MNPRRFMGWLVVVAATLLAGCSSATVPHEPCCYTGDVQLTRAGELSFGLQGGERKDFQDVFPGYEPSSRVFNRDLPFPRVRIGLVVDQDLQEVLPAYDANANAELER